MFPIRARLAPPFLIWLAAFLFTPTLALADSLSGVWVGRYVCAQGVTALTLTIVDNADAEEGAAHDITAVFAFSAAPENPDVPSGAFTMSGRHDPHDEVYLRAEQWIERPDAYETVNLIGRRTELREGEFIRGIVVFPTFPRACTIFEVRRAHANVAALEESDG